VGAWIGGLVYSQPLSVLFLAIGAGAVFQVAHEIGRQMIWKELAKRQIPVTVFMGVLTGMLTLYVTGVAIKIAAARRLPLVPGDLRPIPGLLQEEVRLCDCVCLGIDFLALEVNGNFLAVLAGQLLQATSASGGVLPSPFRPPKEGVFSCTVQDYCFGM